MNHQAGTLAQGSSIFWPKSEPFFEGSNTFRSLLLILLNDILESRAGHALLSRHARPPKMTTRGAWTTLAFFSRAIHCTPALAAYRFFVTHRRRPAVDFNFDKPPSAATLLLIGVGAFLLLCLSCTCTAPFAAFFMRNK